MNLAGELVLSRNRLRPLVEGLALQDAGVSQVMQSLNTVSSLIQEDIMRLRMQPFGKLVSRFRRIVRDLAKSLGKEVDLLVEGGEVELDPAGIAPCGELHLRVVDEEGVPVTNYGLEVNGISIRDLQMSRIVLEAKYVAEEIALIGEDIVEEEVHHDYYDDLPLGKVEVRVKGNGYRWKETTCLLEPGVPQRIEVILEKR